MCPYVLVLAACWGAGVSTGIVGTLRQVFSLRGAEKGLHRGVCVCLFVAGCMAQMCRLGRSVWHTEMPQEGYWCVRCSLTWNIWLPMDPSRNVKGNSYFEGSDSLPLSIFFSLSYIKQTPLSTSSLPGKWLWWIYSDLPFQTPFLPRPDFKSCL